MKQNDSSQINAAFGTEWLLVMFLLLSSSVSMAQQQTNFSGTWIKDPSKSDDFYKSFNVEYSIVQTPKTFDVKQKMVHADSQEEVIHNYAFTLDGKVKNTKKEYGTEINTVKWSTDNKTLTTRSTVMYDTQEVGFTETYTLSDDGLVLTATKSDIIPEALKVTQVFIKKK
jgi:hypothetical protein